MTTLKLGGAAEDGPGPFDHRRFILIGTLALALGIAVFVIWSAVAPLNSAAVAPGVVVVESKRKAVQHLEGGIVQAIDVREGARVGAGEVLITLDDTAAKARLAQLSSQYVAALARRDRLLAETADDTEIAFDAEFRAIAEEREVRQAMALQQDLIRARREARDGRRTVLEQQALQSEEELKGQESRLRASGRELTLVREQATSVRRLLEQGHARRPQLAALERDVARLEGTIGQTRAAIAGLRQRIAETQHEIANLDLEFRSEVIDELQDVESRINELRASMAEARDVLRRTVIRAPRSGRVVGLNVFTVGGVVAPSERLMEIVPEEDELVVEAMIRPEDIDVVHPGQGAEVRLTAFSFRTTPPIPAEVIHVSADRVFDERSRASAYQAKLRLDADALGALDGVVLHPGMATEVMLVLGERTLFDFLLDPLLQSFNRAFREA